MTGWQKIDNKGAMYLTGIDLLGHFLYPEGAVR